MSRAVGHVPPKTVAQYAKHLRDQGHLSKSRGKHHPPANALDAAKLLVAILVAKNPFQGPEAIGSYPELVELLRKDLSGLENHLMSVSVERNTDVAVFEDSIRGQGVIYPKGMEPSRARELGLEDREGRLLEVQRTGWGRFRLLAEFDGIFLAELHRRFG